MSGTYPRARRARAGSLLARRQATLGAHSPIFYKKPLHLVRGSGVFLTDVDGKRYLDGYNNVPHVGHANPEVVQAIVASAAQLNISTRYLTEPVVALAESLLAQFDSELDKVFFVNSGSEANDLALRIARQHTGATGILVTDFSYHGTTIAIAEITTGLPVAVGPGEHVRALRVPDLDLDERPEREILDEALGEVDRAIDSLIEAGHGLSGFLFDPLFSTEGLPRVPAGYIEGICRRVRAAGGLVIADEVQSGFGRVGTHLWGHQMYGIVPDLVSLGKPMGNGHPVGALITTSALLDEFGSTNLYFNTFAGNPVSASAAKAVLDITLREQLPARAAEVGEQLRRGLAELVEDTPGLGHVKGRGLFVGASFIDPATGRADARTAQRVIETMRESGVLISKVGRDDNVLKVRPPLVFERHHADQLLDVLSGSLSP